MGNVVDYFRPTEGNSICDMLTSLNKHQFFNGKEWVTPSYYNVQQLGHLGGSKENWPKDNVDGDNRKFLSFWGESTTKGGCCATDYDEKDSSWGQAFYVYYGSQSKNKIFKMFF